MKPAPFAYRRPRELEEAVGLLAEHRGAKVLAGGQSLVPLLSMRLAAPTMLVDINGLPGLDRVSVTPEGVRVGALARHADVLASDEAALAQPLLREALGHVAHPTIRNRGTTVGSLVHADAAAEMPVVLSLLRGSVAAVGPAGRREIPAAELYVGPLESSLAHDEIAVEAVFPLLAARSGVAFEEIARRHGDYAVVGVAGLVRVDDAGEVVDAHAGLVSVADVPTVLDLSDVPVDRWGSEAAARVEPEGDLHASADFRRHLVEVLVDRVLRRAHERALGLSVVEEQRGTLRDASCLGYSGQASGVSRPRPGGAA